MVCKRVGVPAGGGIEPLPAERGDFIDLSEKLFGVLGESVMDEEPVELSLLTGTLTGMASGTLEGITIGGGSGEATGWGGACCNYKKSNILLKNIYKLHFCSEDQPTDTQTDTTL